MHYSQVAASCFIVARGQLPELLEAAKKAFGFVAIPVKIPVNDALDKAVLFAGNHGLSPHSGHAG